LTGNAAAEPEDAVDWLLELGRDLGIVGLAAYGVGAGDSAEIVRKAAVASSMKANPVVLSDEELASVLESAVG
jgi:alcohol dehydrogenase class IV